MIGYNDKVKLIKKDGTFYENIQANAQPNMVFIKDENTPVEEGDIIERVLPSGVVERKKVIDPGYYGIGGKHSHFAAYQCKVRSISNINNKPNNIIYNINGPTSKINIHSVDNSINNVTTTPQKVFEELEAVIKGQIQNNEEILKILAELKESKDKPDFIEKYRRFVALAADHISLLAPFIPALTQML